jgi:hypothetical protein
MAGSFTDALESAALTFFFTTATAPTRPTSWFLALCSTAPTDSAAGTEITGGGYARQEIGSMTVSGTNPTQAANAGALSFGAATGADWPEAGYFEIWTLVSGGTRIAWGQFDVAKTVQVGDTLNIAAGDAKVTIS